MPTKDCKYTLARQNIEQGSMEGNWRKNSAGAAKKKKMKLA